jgi:hypothetical protein
MPTDVEDIARFMASPDAGSLDGGVWTRRRAAQFVHFMLQNRGSVVRVAIGDYGIAGIVAVELVIRRSGPALSHLTCVARRSRVPGLPGVSGILLADIADAANRQSTATYNMPITGLELTERLALQLAPVLPGIRGDEDFIGMSMPFDALMKALESRLRFAGSYEAPAIAGSKRRNEKISIGAV